MSILKTVGLCILSIVILAISQGVASIWYMLKIRGIESILFAITYIGLSYIFLKLMVEKILHRNLADFRIKGFGLKPWWILLGIAIPVFVIACFLIFIKGDYSVTQMSAQKTINSVIFAIFVTGIGAGVVEEMVFRGIIMKLVEEKSNAITAILLPSILFAAVHLMNGKLQLSSALLLILGGTFVGVLFSAMTYLNDSTWASTSLHVLWNIFIIGGIFNIGITKDPTAIVNYKLHSTNLFLTGGEFGIEVAMFAIIAYLLSTLAVYMNRGKLSKNK